MLRKILAVIAAVLGFVIGTSIVQMIGHALFPFPPGIDPADPAQIAAIIDRIPFAAKAFVILSYFAGAVAGGWAALAIARWRPALWIMVALAWAASVANILAIPHPLWMVIGSFIAPALGAGIATFLPLPRRKPD